MICLNPYLNFDTSSLRARITSYENNPWGTSKIYSYLLLTPYDALFSPGKRLQYCNIERVSIKVTFIKEFVNHPSTVSVHRQLSINNIFKYL